MRTLFLPPRLPYPPDNGGRQRLWHTLEAIAAISDVDVLVLGHVEATPVDDLTRALPGVRATSAPPGRRTVTPMNLARCLAQRTIPSTVWFRDLEFPAETLGTWAFGSYDLVWDACPVAAALLADRHLGPVIVDRYDLEEEFLRGMIRIERLRRHPRQMARARLDVKRWIAFNGIRSRRAAQVLVCSEADRARVAAPNVRVVPNGYVRTTPPLGRRTVGDPPTLLLPGLMKYGPNVDAARHFVRHVWPRVRAVVPRAELRIVGDCGPEVASLAVEPNVVVTGFVPTMEAELARSDAVIVPVRYGSGTRVKLLEAFANRIPAVSTTIGAEGLAAVDGTHLLLADDDDGFASACVRALFDVELRDAMVENAEQLYLARYQWSEIRTQIQELARSVAGAARTRAGEPGAS
jgi:glycosyltransferase involved in cell wall biosynthesis